MDKVISVIIPVHNSAETIDRCVESVVNQTYTNLEIILVENGSTDNTLELCNKWAEKDNRIKVFVSDKGVSKARNLGLDMASGEYFAFVDSDDYIDTRTYESCINSIIAGDEDMIYFQTNSQSCDSGRIFAVKEKNIEELVNNKNLKYFFCNGNESIRGGVIRILFLKERFENIRFNESLCFSEDLLFHLECLEKSLKRVLLQEYFYYNVNNHDKPHAFSKKYYKRENFFNVRQVLLERQSDILKNYCGDEVLDAIKFGDIVFYINSIIVNEKNYIKKIKEFLANPFWKSAFNLKNYKKYCKHLNYNISKSYKIQAFLIAHRFYRLYSFAMKLYEKKA